MPERCGYILFSSQETGSELPPFEQPYSEMQKQYLWLIFYRQNRKYSSSLAELGIDPTVEINGKVNSLSIESTSAQFTATIGESLNH